MSGQPVFNRLALIGIGLIGSSIARARARAGRRALDRRHRPLRRRRAGAIAELGLADQVVETNAAAVEGADLVIVCDPGRRLRRGRRGDRPAS